MQSLSEFRDPDTVKTYGIEIECFFLLTAAPATYQHNGFFYAATDGSIKPTSYAETGVELVSQPMPVAWLCKEITRLQKRVGEWRHNESCGIHVHVNRKWFTEKKAVAVRAWCKGLSRADCHDLFGREPNGYCCQDAPRWDRYGMVNTTNEKTVELRMFSSGDAKWAQYCVKMADWLVRNAFQLNLEAAYAARDLFKHELGIQ